MAPAIDHTDVVIIGAGISGINAAYRVQSETSCSYTLLETRSEIGGTWALFNYPGIRSDSDMFTLGFPFYPWTRKKTIADGADICDYVRETASHFGIDKKIEFNQKVASAAWSSKEALWTINIDDVKANTTRKMTTRFLLFATGYYDYNEGYYPDLKGMEKFKGDIVKPQFWPEDLNYKGKKVVIVGSGATAVTLLPNMAKEAAHVTLLQRSPSYFVTLPSVDKFASVYRKIFPAFLATILLRLQFQAKSSFFYYMCRMFPNALRKVLRFLVKRELPPNIPLDPHFNPSYKPWDQRICMVPDGDMFKAFRAGTGSIATGHIKTLTSNSIVLESGQEIEADLIVQATGLKVQLLGGSSITIDGKKLKVSHQFIYKGQMLEGVPNMSLCFGYTNASWSLGSDLCSRYVCKLLNYMKENGYATVKPYCDHSKVTEAPATNLSSGYLQRAKDEMPKATNSSPWNMKNNYFMDYLQFKFGKGGNVVENMEFFPARS
ncbi:hypothetical protein CBS101457_006201 [Exobasidium rhododendri]|nr:hypothetical protein CBS101457_006201 [Exobasidium rhododendri]